jgi:deoxycytidylate deaminase
MDSCKQKTAMDKEIAFNLMRKSAGDNNTIFDDAIYRKCFNAAADSECQKMKFGTVILHGSEVVYEGTNAVIEPLRSLCEPKCIRLEIASRTEQMLGACCHAEELGLWAVAKQGILLSECKLYVAGFYPNNSPYLKKAPEHTCLRCSVQMYNSGVGIIYVPVNDHWAGISGEEAVKTATAYALGNKRV